MSTVERIQHILNVMKPLTAAQTSKFMLIGWSTATNQSHGSVESIAKIAVLKFIDIDGDIKTQNIQQK